MASVQPGHVSLNGSEYAIVESTYTKQTQTPFNNRFSTGDPSVGDLSFFQFLSMDDFSGGNGQEIFVISNRFIESDGVDVTTPGELKLAPKLELLASVNGPQHEHLNEPVEDEDGWPQVIEWLGQAVIFNDRIEYDAGGVDFLEVFDTDVIRDKVINKGTTGTSGVITNDTHATILDITKATGLPGDVFKVTARFQTLTFIIPNRRVLPSNVVVGRPADPGPYPNQRTYDMKFRIYFGGLEPGSNLDDRPYSEVVLNFERDLFTITPLGSNSTTFQMTEPVTVEILVRVPILPAGVYTLWTSAGFVGSEVADPVANASVLFYIESVSEVLVNRKNLYAPQLKAACVAGNKLIGGRVFDGTAYLEVYQKQNEAIDRILQVDLTANSTIPDPPTYMALIASNDVIVAAFDNKIYKIDITTAGLTSAQRITAIGTVLGDYVSGMEVWNQRVYIASFDKSRFTSSISWTNLEVIERSYAIDGKFWITDLATFNGALFYSGGTQDGIGQVRAFPSEIILELKHPEFDNRVRCLNAGRKLYAGWSHGTGVAVIDERGASTWAKLDLGENSTNVVWDIEEVGNTVYILADGGLFKTSSLFQKQGTLETSRFGANTPLIEKDWSSVLVEAKEVLLGSHKIKLWAALSSAPDTFTLIGEMGQNEIASEFIFPSNFSGTWMNLFVELITEDESTSPIIKKITIKYIPQSLDKFQWAFGIRAINNITFLNGDPEPRSGAQITSDLFTLPSIGNFTFRDIDDEEYDVIVSNMKQTNPVINKKGIESLVMVELLEI